MSWISAARGARKMRLVGAVALVSAVLTPVATSAPSASADTAPPSIASTSYPKFVESSSMRWRGTHWSATPSFRWTPTTTAGVAKYQVQTWHGKRRGSMVGMDSMGSGYQSRIANYPASRTSVAGHIYSGDQVCRRVRAVNSAGTVGRWSGWKCSYAPLGTEEFVPGYGFDNGVFDYYARNNGASNNPIRSASYLAKGVRVKVRTGPKYGKARILIGSTLLGTVSGYASKSGYKVVTLQKSANLTGAIKVRAISDDSRPFRFVGLWALRSTAPLGSSRVVTRQSPSELWPVTDPVESSDTTRPKMIGFSLSPTFPTTRNSNGFYSVKASWRGSDNVKVTGYEVATKHGGSTSYYDGGSGATTSTSMPVIVDWAGSATCHRVRAFDAAGNFSPWTSWKCSHAPLMPMTDWTASAGPAVAGKAWTSVRMLDDYYHRPARTKDRYSAKKLRIQYRVGPRWGRAKVYVSGTYFGTINAYSSTVGTKWVTLTATREAHERIRFVPVTTKDVLIGKVFVIPDPAKNLPPAPTRG
ncbi:hypothetical protein [Nocardioides sp. NPDC127503]|uniref:hypothetical protein n=1 Tax=Nocardioides sp. NPDC127503 TaxID=3154516 RepID=UPI0033169D32